MAKLDTPAVAPAGLRPPQPAVRMRGAAPDVMAEEVIADDAAEESIDPSEIEYADVVEVEAELDEPSLSLDSAAPGAHGLDEVSITERGFDASTFGLPRLNGGTKLPLANLEMPSASRLDLTPSPVPRVALTPATGAVDISLVPGPHGSRNLPTLAAHHALGRRPVRRPAAAVTVPPPRGATREAPRLGSGIARDVRSSKREIVLGLAIGLGLSLVLAAAGSAYLRGEPVASSPVPELQALTLSAYPGAGAAALPGAGAAALPGAEAAAPQSAPPAPETPLAGRADPPSASAAVPQPGERATPSGRASRAAGASVLAHALGGAAGADGPARTAAPRERGRRARSTGHGSAPARAHGTRSPSAPALEGTRAFEGNEPPEGKSSDGSKSFEEPPPARAPLSPAESAGLGLDLPL